MDYRKDYYQVLEVPVTASKEEIRAAYRRLAKLYHPDKNAGNAEAEEKFKLINEANEILSNEILRHEYDAYRLEQERWKKMQADKETGKEEIKASNKKTYTKTKTIVTETRIYIQGEIRVKYWASCEERVAAGYNAELDYKINPTEAIIIILEQHIYPSQGIPLDYLKAFKQSDIFLMPIPQPIRCEVMGEHGKEYFQLTLSDIRIKNIKLEGVTKHENNSYGTLTGQVYGYSPKFTYTEEEETVTECFGETGNIERKEENGFTYLRKEYYHPDCSTYWSDWIQVPKPKTTTWTYQKSRVRTPSVNYSNSSANVGCGIFAWIIALLCMLFVSPPFFVFCLIVAILWLLFYQTETIFSFSGRLFSVIGTILLLIFLIVAALSISHPNRTYIRKKEEKASVKTTRTIRELTPNGDSATTIQDTLITHFLKWKDYAGRPYEGPISISVAALRSANQQHLQMDRSFYQDINEIYTTMLDHDSSQMGYLYHTFDSIKATNNLNEVAFSQMLVSAIQSLPYFLVLDKSCDDNYNDDFTRNFLANCKTDCCIGYELFGVRTPVEFLSDLKGDCDTRSLLLYQVLKHYNYNVALLTSNYYKHAMIAVSFTEAVPQPGLGITIGDKKYYMWETTAPDLNYGTVSSNFNNLTYWNISLVNKKIQQ
jgi:curved DNA-binding protein CbpA